LTAGRAYSAEWRKKNPQAERAKQERYRKNNPEAVKAKLAKWRESEKGKRWNQAYAPQQRESWRRSYYRDLDRSRMGKILMMQRRRNRMRGTCTVAQANDRISYYGERCYVCAAPWEALDHVKPIAKGGANWPANLRPICRHCNAKKSSKWTGISGMKELLESL